MRTSLHWLMVIALSVRAFLPAGVMLLPAGDGRGGVSVVICTGTGPMTLDLDADGKPVPQQNTAKKAETCPFGAANTVGLAAEPPTLSRAVEFAAAVYRLDQAHFSATPQPRAQSARGPPSILS